MLSRLRGDRLLVRTVVITLVIVFTGLVFVGGVIVGMAPEESASSQSVTNTRESRPTLSPVVITKEVFVPEKPSCKEAGVSAARVSVLLSEYSATTAPLKEALGEALKGIERRDMAKVNAAMELIDEIESASLASHLDLIDQLGVLNKKLEACNR